MKKIAFILSLLTIAFTAFAQNNGTTSGSGMPIDPATGLVTYEGIIDEEANAEVLYQRALEWFNKFYPNARGVLKEQDKENGKITGKHKFRIQIKDDKGVATDAGFIIYDIKIWVKDNKYRYRISDIHLEYVTHFGIEEWMNETNKDKDGARKLAEIDKFMKNLVENLKKGMEPKPEEFDEDKW